MTTEWKDLPTLQDVAYALADGWDIEVQVTPSNAWEHWHGNNWKTTWSFQGRPKMKKMKMLCWLCNDSMYWFTEGRIKNELWVRVPSEDKEIEVPE